jgi:hypothetical protein
MTLLGLVLIVLGLLLGILALPAFEIVLFPPSRRRPRPTPRRASSVTRARLGQAEWELDQLTDSARLAMLEIAVRARQIP